MAHRRNRPINLPAPYLKRVWIDPSRVSDPAAYPFCLPFLQREFDLAFDPGHHHHRRREQRRKIDAARGDRGNGRLRRGRRRQGLHAGRSFQRGRGDGRPPVAGAARRGCRRSPPDGSFAPRASSRWRAISTRRPWKATAGRRTSCRIRMARALRFFEERCRRQGIFIFDEPESALSPSARQIEFLNSCAAWIDRDLPGHHGDPRRSS